MTRACLVLAVTAAFFALQSAHADEPQDRSGLIIGVKGDVSVVRGQVEKPAVQGSILELGDTLIVKIGAWCEGFNTLGEHFELTGPAQLATTKSVINELEGGIIGWISRQLTQWCGQSRYQALATRSVRDWDEPMESPLPLFPAPDGRVRFSESRFVWRSLPEADAYLVALALADGDEIRQRIRGHKLLKRDLEAGMEYVWKVDSEIGDGVVGSQWRQFRVLTREEEAMLDQAVANVNDLAAGVLLLSSGLHEEAILRLDAAYMSNETRSSALLWRAQAFAEVGLFQHAYADLLEAQSQR